MKVSIVRQTKIEINRLLTAIGILENTQGNKDDDQGGRYYVTGKDTAAVRRASMDLSRSLTALRRGF